MSEEYHIPVLLNESIDGLNVKPEGTYVDITYGGGGHSREILRRLGNKGRLIAFDQDSEAYANKIEDFRLIFIKHNFRYIAQFLHYLGIEKVDGILGDLGVSSHHFDSPERGFSFRFDAPLDMRMSQALKTTAATILNSYSEKELTRIFADYGEIQHPVRLSNAIVEARAKSPIETTFQLRDIACAIATMSEHNKLLARVFQALRIEVNNEMSALHDMLSRTAGLLKKDGRLVIIAYHSLEDRMVKNMIRSGNCDTADATKDVFGHAYTTFEAINRKPIVPTDKELEHNSRSRSAKLRIARRTAYQKS